MTDLGEKLSKRDIVSANIYNSCSVVTAAIGGMNNVNVASWNDYVFATAFAGSVPGLIATTAYNHSSAKKDSLTVIKSLVK